MLYDHVFLKIINSDDLDTLDAIDLALDAQDYHLSKAQLAQLHILCGMQKQILILKELRDIESAESMDECNPKMMEYINSKMGEVKVIVEPIEKD